MVKHMVMWKYREDVDPDETFARMDEIFAGFMGEVPGLVEYSLNRGFAGFDSCLICHHQDRDALEVYQTVPAHLEAKTYIHSVVAQRASCDFEE